MTTGNIIEPLLTVREVAEILHVHPNTVRRWGDQGIIRPYRIPQRGDRRFQKADVVRCIESMLENNGGPAAKPE